MTFTAKQAKSNHLNYVDVNHILELIYKKIKVDSKDKSFTVVKFGEDPGFHDIFPNDQDSKKISDNLEFNGYEVEWVWHDPRDPQLIENPFLSPDGTPLKYNPDAAASWAIFIDWN